MRTNIIGGGVAGLFSAVALHQAGITAAVYERAETYQSIGLGFLLLSNGLSALRSLGLEEAVLKEGEIIHKVIIRDTKGTKLLSESLENCLSIPRFKLIQVLKGALPSGSVNCGMKFGKLKNNVQKKPEVTFENGYQVESDLLLGSDGVKSSVRKAIFPDLEMGSSGMKEIVCMTPIPEIACRLNQTFIKTQKLGSGLAIGNIPAGNGMVIWFLQFNPKRHPAPEKTPDAIREFVYNLVGDWATPIPEILSLSDFRAAHIWDVKKMDALPSFFNQRVVLVGDAAHPMLSLTSQGANSAMVDGLTLAKCLEEIGGDTSRIAEALRNYTQQRQPKIKSYVEMGNQLLHNFLNPSSVADGKISIPLAGKCTK